MQGVGIGASMGAAPVESSCRKISKSLVRRGDAEKGKSASSKITCQEIKTPVTFVVSEVSEENTSGGPMCQFVSSFGGEIRTASTTEHVQVLIGGATPWRVKYGLVVLITLVRRRFSKYVAVWSSSTQYRARIEALKSRRHHIINGVDDAFGFTILWRSVGTTHP
jgi:hypothetical protein